MAAAENNDKLWPVLRFHLAVELLLTFYINEKHIGEITKYAKLPRDLGGNFFLQLYLIYQCFCTDNLPDIAHKLETSIQSDDIKEFPEP